MAANYHSDRDLATREGSRWVATGGWDSFHLEVATSAVSGRIGRTTVGTDTPRFHARKRAGELLPFTAFDQYEYDSVTGFFTFDQQSITYTATSGHRVRMDDIPLGEATRPGLQFMAGQVSYEGLLQQLASKANGWDALTFVAEAHQLRAMLLGLVTKVSQLLRQRPPKFTVNQWLELRYGWRVLYYDMLSIAEAVNSLNTKRKFSKYTSGTSFSTKSESTTIRSDSWWSAVERTTNDFAFNVRAKLVMTGEVSPIRINPLATAWELLRFSFVIDWFMSVGNAIDALSLSVSGASYVVGAGYKVEVNSRVTLENPTLQSGSFYTVAPTWTDSVCTGFCVSRSPASIPLRPLWNPRLSPGKLTDLIALILQRALR